MGDGEGSDHASPTLRHFVCEHVSDGSTQAPRDQRVVTAVSAVGEVATHHRQDSLVELRLRLGPHGRGRHGQDGRRRERRRRTSSVSTARPGIALTPAEGSSQQPRGGVEVELLEAAKLRRVGDRARAGPNECAYVSQSAKP